MTDITFIKKILSKQVFSNPDSVLYMEEYCKHTLTYTEYGIMVQNIHDTVAEGYNFTRLANDLSIKYLPDQLVPMFYIYGRGTDEYQRVLSGPFGVQTQVVYSGDVYADYYNPPCWEGPDEIQGTDTYSVGLGHTSFWAWQQNWDTYTEYIVYYQKGSVIWGTPVAPNCMTLVPIDNQPKQPVDIEIIPNPVVSSADVHTSGLEDVSGMTFTLLDGFGRKIMTLEVPAKIFNLDCSSLHPGLYLYRLIDNSGKSLHTGKLVVE